jgi:hypothetical protein
VRVHKRAYIRSIVAGFCAEGIDQYQDKAAGLSESASPQGELTRTLVHKECH